MKYIISIFFSTFLLILASQSKAQTVVGIWNLDQVIIDGQDVASEHDPEDERWISLQQDSSFKSGGRPYGANNGSWSYNQISYSGLKQQRRKG